MTQAKTASGLNELYLVLGKNQDISSGQVTVNEPPLLQIRHSIGDLECQVTQQAHTEHVANQVVLKTVE